MKEFLADVSISAPDPSNNFFPATNLITNLVSRTSGNNLKPMINSLGNRATYESCYKTSYVQLEPLDNKLEITINFGAPYFMHCILMVQDVFEGIYQNDHLASSNEWVQNVEVYIGNIPDYKKN